MAELQIEIRKAEHPLDWARHHAERIAAPFGGTWTAAVDVLGRELGHLEVDLVVIELYGPKLKIRRDGWPTANSIVDPPVKVSFSTEEHGPLAYRSDRYDHWHLNVHAVGLTLDRLRAVTRYGCAAGGEQYRGWAGLPAGDGAQSDELGGRTPVEALAWVLGWEPSSVGADIGAAVREARRKAHPDQNQGQRVIWDIVDAAAQRLGID